MSGDMTWAGSMAIRRGWASWTVTVCCAALSIVALRTTAAPLDRYLRSLGYGSIPLQRGKGNQLLANGMIEGRKVLLQVDTGATLTALDKKWTGKLKSVDELGVNLVDPVLKVRMPKNALLIRELVLGEAKFSNQPVVPIPLHPSGIAHDGILGCDFLMRQHALLDCAGKRLFVRKDTLSAKAKDALSGSLGGSGYHRAPLKRTDSLVLACRVLINRVETDLLVDSGAPFTIVDDDTANRCRVLWQQTSIELNGIGKRGGVRLWSGRPDVFEVGGGSMLYPDLSIGACEMKSWDIGEKRAGVQGEGGVLGSELLGRSNALVDFDTGTLWFVPAGTATK